MSQELILYTDESDKKGQYFGNFYGGALVRSADVRHVDDQLRGLAVGAGLLGEIKWQKVSSAYLERYRAVVDGLFDLVRADRVKLRIMFTQARIVPTNLTDYHRGHSYHLLYYQFLKHAFGLQYCNQTEGPIRLRIYLDNLPDTKENNAIFKGHIVALEKSRQFRDARILVPADQIAEVCSHDHIVLQCLDVVLGAMQFRLNDKHLVKPEGARTRGAKTLAKEKLYKHINRRICEIYPRFNVGITTGTPNGPIDRWNHPYRHWRFVPREAEIDETRGKRARRENA